MSQRSRSLRHPLVPAILIAAVALVLQPQPAMCQDSTLGIVVNDVFSDLFGAAAGEGLGCLVQGCSSSPTTPDWSKVSTQLSNLSTQINKLSGDIQQINCTLTTDAYATYMAGTNNTTLNSIQQLAADLSNIAADRAAGNTTQLTQDLNQLTTDQKIPNLATLHADMNGIVRGTASSAGGIQLFSNKLTACHTYFNSNDFLLVQKQWALFALAQANACVIKINLDNSNNGNPADDIAACKAYQADINTAQVQQMKTPSVPQFLQSNTFIDLKTGIGWQVGGTVTSSCQQLWDNGGGNAFIVCAIPGVGRSGAPWQSLPNSKDVQVLLNDSGCPSPSGGQSGCIQQQGWPVDPLTVFVADAFWADGAYKNVIDPSPKGPWRPNSYCEQNGCICANGDCYDWLNVIYQDSNGNTVPRFPPCWTYAAAAPGSPGGADVYAFECGIVDAGAAGFNNTGSVPRVALNLQEWVDNNAPNGAPGAPFATGYYWAGAPPFKAAYVAAARPTTGKTASHLTAAAGK